jgi:hypothetical protein
MKTVFFLLFICSGIANTFAQVKPAVPSGNKAKLAQLDSLLKVIEKKKNDLSQQLTDFLRASKELEQSKDSSIKGKTIEERLNSVEKNAAQRKMAGKKIILSPGLLKLESITTRIRKTIDDINSTREKWKDKKDSISEMGQMDMQVLQQMMDKKNQLETLISNAIKASYEGGQVAIQALKAS